MDDDAASGALETAVSVARAAGEAAMRYYGAAGAEYKQSESGSTSPVTEADHAANRVIVDGLSAAFPDDAILSEESKDSPDRVSAGRLWIVDPLDGTKEFLAQNGEFAIMIGRVVDSEPEIGVVYRPADDVLFAAARDRGARIERSGRRERLVRGAADPDRLRLVGSRSHADPLLERMRDALGITDIRPSGSVGVKCGLIADGERDLYIHPVPYLKEWDTCAPEVILREAGGDVVDCRGGRLRYDKPDPRQPHGIVACAPGVLDHVLDRIGPVYENREAYAST